MSALPQASPLPIALATAPHPNFFPVRLWLWRLRVRRELAALHPGQIREAGHDPVAVRRESLKPFWRG